MNTYIILIVLIIIAAAFAYINHRFIKMPFVIGLFFLSTILAVVALISRIWIEHPYVELRTFVEQTNISKFILNILLGLLLFAGSLHTDWLHIKQQLKQITLLALGGVLVSTIIIAALFYGLTVLFSLNIDFIYCLLFGALISPTDPIAVLGILTKVGIPKKTETIIIGESLFNDGVGVVTFVALLEALKTGSNSICFSNFGMLFLREAIGGIVFGLALGFLLHKLLKSIDDYVTEVLLTIAFVMAGYYFATELNLSGALAMVVMGMLVGNYEIELVMSNTSKEYVHTFWELVDVILNAVLFILVALVVVVIDLKIKHILIGFLSIFIVLISRIIIVYLPKWFFPKIADYSNKEAKILVWGGLRGGLSIAMVLSLPDNENKNILLIATYFCVLFSILVQGTTIEKLVRKKN
ncbi:MAG: sodium:proton antiporter [Ferruginibacter sp.]